VHLALRFSDRHDIAEILLKVVLATMKQISVMLIPKKEKKTFYLMNENVHVFSKPQGEV
jgi:hypothetical protein